MAVARRPLLTATAAGTLLAALWFVPSANATDDQADVTGRTMTSAAGPTGRGAGSTDRAVDSADRGTDAADRSADSTVVPVASDASDASVTPVTSDLSDTSGTPDVPPGTADAPNASDTHGRGATAAVSASSSGPRLADTGVGVDTTPYLVGGVAFLGVGAAFVTHSIRRAGASSLRSG